MPTLTKKEIGKGGASANAATGNANHSNDFLKELSDPKKYKVFKGVPVFRPHKRTLPAVTDPETGKEYPEFLIDVREEDLPEIAEITNDSGPQIMTEGHRKLDPNFPENKQPRKTGWETNHRPGHYVFNPKKGPEPCILADLHYDADMFNEVGPKRYPFRSADYDFKEKRITGMALLVRRPWLDLGLISDCAYMHMRHIVQYSMENPMPMDEKKVEDEEMLSPEDEAHYAKICKYLAGKDKRFAAYAKKCMPAMAKYFDEGAGSMTDPGTDTTYAGSPKPGSDGFKAMKAKEDPNYPWYDDKDYQADQRVAQYATENKILKDRIASQQCEMLLNDVVGVVKCNKERETKILLALPESERPGHIQYMKDTYEKLPVSGTKVEIAKGNDGKKGDNQAKKNNFGTMTQAQYWYARNYQELNNCTVAEANAKALEMVKS